MFLFVCMSTGFFDISLNLFHAFYMSIGFLISLIFTPFFRDEVIVLIVFQFPIDEILNIVYVHFMIIVILPGFCLLCAFV